MQNFELKKILIIRFSSIGDIVLTTPVVRCLKKQLPNTEIHFLSKKSFQTVLQHNPYIDKLHLVDEKLSEVIPDLIKENFDFIIDLHKNLRSLRIKNAVKKPAQSFNKLNIEKWLLVNFKINKMPDKHIVDRYFETTKSLGITNDGQGLDYFLTENDACLNQIPSSFSENGFIAWVIGGQHETKKMPSEKIISIAKKINKNIILIGGKEDFKDGEKISALVGRDKVFNACGKFTLNQSAYLVKNAEKVISNDTGLMHIAAAFKKNILSLWGNTVPEFGMYPYLAGKDSKIMQIKNLHCRPCSKLGFKKCPKKHFYCMMMQDEVEIADWANV